MGKHIARGLLLAAGVLMAGCGGVESAEESSPALTTREDQILCTDPSSYYVLQYYSDNTYTVMVGERSCDCLGPVTWGSTSLYYRQDSGSCW